MKILLFVFVKITRKILRIIYYGLEYLYYRFFYIKPKLKLNFVPRRFLIENGENLDDIAHAYRKLFPNKIEAKITEADLIC